MKVEAHLVDHEQLGWDFPLSNFCANRSKVFMDGFNSNLRSFSGQNLSQDISTQRKSGEPKRPSEHIDTFLGRRYNEHGRRKRLTLKHSSPA